MQSAIVWTMLSLVSAGLTVPVVVEPAYAQTQKRRNLLDRLFNRKKAPEPAAQPRPRKTTAPARNRSKTSPRRRRATQSAAHTRPDTPKAPAVLPKHDNARLILVIGDFVADGLADGLVEAFAQSPDIKIVKHTRGASGLVRNDHYDWPGEIEAVINKVSPQAVVVMLGANDRQSLLVEGKRQPVRSDSWLGEYNRRADQLSSAIANSNRPFIWVGQISFRPKSMSGDMLAFNDIYRQAAQKSGAQFVDVWEGFVNENGQFTASGPDINGQIVKLRASDGINVTRAGQRKLAFYLEKSLTRLLGSPEALASGSWGPQGLPQLSLTRFSTNEEGVRLPPIGFDDPELDGGLTLLGANPSVATSPAFNQLPPKSPAPVTRIDNFQTP